MNACLFFVNTDWHLMCRRFKSWKYVILKKFGQHISEMMAVAVNNFHMFLYQIRQNVNIATNAILLCDLTSVEVSPQCNIALLTLLAFGPIIRKINHKNSLNFSQQLPCY